MSAGRSFRIEVEHQADGWAAHAHELRCFGTGDDLRKALDDLADSICFLHANLRTDPDEQLADDARELRDRLAWLFGAP